MMIGYARVSTTDQNLDLQLRALREAGCQKLYTETQSGADPARPVLARCLGSLAKGDTLVVWKLDRLARSTLQLTTIVADLQHRGIDFKSLTQPLDTTTPAGKLIFIIFAAIAEFERDMIKERVSAGIAAAKARGVHCGRPRKINGEVVMEGESLQAAARELGISRHTLYNQLDRQSLDETGNKRPRRAYHKRPLAAPLSRQAKAG